MDISANTGFQSALQSGVQGFNAASNNVNQAAQSIADRTTLSSQESPSTAQVDIASSQPTSQADDLVQLSVGQRQAEANIVSIQTANNTIGSLIDEFV